MAVIDDELLRSFDDAVLDVNEARLLPPLCYTADWFYEFEKEAVFGHDWFCVGHIGQLPGTGDYFTLAFLDEPLIVVRGKDDRVRVLSAVCRHRGMVVAEGRGSCTTFRCPYHHWTYGTDGRLLGAPAMERRVAFDKSEHGLPSLPVEIWNGFIFANFEPDAPPLGPTLAQLDTLLRNFGLTDATWVDGGLIPGLAWNWKVMFENFNDAYHANRLHAGIGDFVPSEKALFFDIDDDENHITRCNYHTHIDASFNPQMKTVLPVFPGLTEDERWRSMFALVPPSLCLAIVPDEVAYFLVLPNGPAEIAIWIGYLFDASVVENPSFEQLFEVAKAGVNNFNVQDIYADTMVQRGLQSRFAPRGPYSWQETTLAQFNRWLVKRYRAHARSAGVDQAKRGTQ